MTPLIISAPQASIPTKFNTENISVATGKAPVAISDSAIPGRPVQKLGVALPEMAADYFPAERMRKYRI